MATRPESRGAQSLGMPPKRNARSPKRVIAAARESLAASNRTVAESTVVGFGAGAGAGALADAKRRTKGLQGYSQPGVGRRT